MQRVCLNEADGDLTRPVLLCSLTARAAEATDPEVKKRLIEQGMSFLPELHCSISYRLLTDLICQVSIISRDTLSLSSTRPISRRPCPTPLRISKASRRSSRIAPVSTLVLSTG